MCLSKCAEGYNNKKGHNINVSESDQPVDNDALKLHGKTKITNVCTVVASFSFLVLNYGGFGLHF